MKINISGNTATITTTITPAQIEKVMKLKPELLLITDEETKKGIFLVSYAKTGTGSITNNSATFVPSIGGNLVIEVKLPAGISPEQAKEAMFSYAAKAKAYIETIEERIEDNFDDIVAAEAEFLGSIEIG